jgi:hypothetical protein
MVTSPMGPFRQIRHIPSLWSLSGISAWPPRASAFLTCTPVLGFLGGLGVCSLLILPVDSLLSSGASYVASELGIALSLQMVRCAPAEFRPVILAAHEMLVAALLGVAGGAVADSALGVATAPAVPGVLQVRRFCHALTLLTLSIAVVALGLLLLWGEWHGTRPR